MSFATLALQPETGMRFAVQVQGIPFLFLDGAIPVGPDGSPWSSAPSLPDDGSVAPQPCAVIQALDPTDGLVDAGAEITRSSSDVTPSSMRFVLREQYGDVLLDLFARHKSTGRLANLVASVTYGDTGGAGYTVLPLDSASGWSEGDVVYFGRETLVVASIDDDSLTCTRNNWALAGSQSRFVLDADRPTAPRIVADYPRVWVGRYVRLWAFPVAADGIAYDSDWFGDNAREVWRGVINADPRPGSDWSSWELDADSIESVLRTEVGLESRHGSLLRVPGGLAQNQAGTVEVPAGAPPPQATYWVAADTNYVDLTITEWADIAAYGDGAAPVGVWAYTGEGAIALFDAPVPRVATRASIRLAFEAVADVLHGAPGLEQFRIDATSDGRWYVTTHDPDAFYIVAINWDAAGSIGPLLGFSGITEVQSGRGSVYAPDVSAAAVYVHKTATTIPFFYADAASLPAPASGFAIIGDGDEAEVVQYASIAALFNDLDGLYVMEGCTRGRFGTVARDFSAAPPTGDKAGDAVKISFGVGWDDVPFPEVVLQLATSTGAGVNGAYDLLPDSVGARLSLEHFDPAAFIELAERLGAWEVRRSILLMKGMRLSELLGSWLQPLGRFILGRTLADGTYRISIGESLPAIESDIQTAITTRNVQLEPAPKYGAAGRIINQIRAYYHWSPAKSEASEGAYVDVLDDDSISEYGVRNKLEWKMPGWTGDAGTALGAVLDWASDVFRRFGRPFDIISLDTDRTAWLVSPGDTVTLTIPGFPSTRGTRGETTNAVVLQVERRYSGEEIGGALRLAIEEPERCGRYVPCARVDALDGDDVLQLGAEFSDDDAAHFAAGDHVWVYEDEADVSSRVHRVVDFLDGPNMTLTAALPGGFTPGPDTLVTWYDYGSAAARQRRFAYICANDGEFASGAPAEGFHYA